jgi:predicted short-subunit dehydrogenase-like oxidoreductase (DUF2520 family)
MKIDVSIVGAGNLGTALAYALHDAGVPVNEIISRRPNNRLRHLAKHIGAALVDLEEASLKSRVIWITTPDSAIAEIAASIANKTTLSRQIVLHSSGVLSSAILQPTRLASAAIASAHPMMSFPRPAAVSLRGVTWAVEGDAPAVKTAREIIKQLAGTSLKLSAKTKPLYHSLGTLSSPILVSLLTAAESTGRASGLSRHDIRVLMRPIIERTTANFFAQGPAASFSGPFERGDVDTISLHLTALQSLPTVNHLYRAAALHALATLPVKNREAIRALLQSQNKPASRPRRRASAKSVRN